MPNLRLRWLPSHWNNIFSQKHFYTFKLTGDWNNWLEIFRENKLSLENTILHPGGFTQKVHLAFKHSTPDNSCQEQEYHICTTSKLAALSAH